LKTILPVPEPKTMPEEALTVPGATAEDPEAAPMFSVPVEVA
jgi:hypothetical protein